MLNVDQPIESDVIMINKFILCKYKKSQNLIVQFSKQIWTLNRVSQFTVTVNWAFEQLNKLYNLSQV